MLLSVVIPAYNEQGTIREVIQSFHSAKPDAFIYVVDNNSSDATGSIARETIESGNISGAVIFVKAQGKGNAIRHAFQKIDADFYVIADADGSHSPADLENLLTPVLNDECDMTIGDRLTEGRYAAENRRLFHGFGNKLVKNFINAVFRSRLRDIMSGYRAFNRAFVDNLPILSPGFQIETEITLHALDKKWRIREIPIDFTERSHGNPAKLRTFSDGFRVLKTIFLVFKDFKPLYFFGLWALLFFIVGLYFGIPVVTSFIKTKQVGLILSAVLSTGLMIFSILSLAIGLILDSVVKFHKLDYLVKLNNYYSARHTRTTA